MIERQDSELRYLGAEWWGKYRDPEELDFSTSSNGNLLKKKYTIWIGLLPIK